MPNEHSDDLKFEIGHVLFIDIVGYSKLSQRNDKLAQELLEEHRRLLYRKFREIR